MIKVVPALTAHAEKIKPKKLYLDNPHWRDELRTAIGSYEAAAFLTPDGVAAVMGISYLWPRSAELWAWISDDVNKSPIEFARKARRLLEWYRFNNPNLKRLQMAVRRGYNKEIDFAVFLGFEPEGILRSYGPEGDDYIMMGRVF